MQRDLREIKELAETMWQKLARASP